MPKRSRKGVASSPARVVAPTSVNGARSIRTLRAAGPSPMMRSSWKSSIAGYRISSMAGCSRWISSMNSTSRGCRLVRIAARSPARWITGPEVARNPTPSSRATICASVVLPRPGGPCSSTWSSASDRARAASMKIARFSRLAFWPTKSDSVCGRSDASAASSMARTGETVRSVSLTAPTPSTRHGSPCRWKPPRQAAPRSCSPPDAPRPGDTRG